jgi:hypothetical protein
MNNEIPNQLEPTTESGAVSTVTNRRRRGFVARLPKTFRDKINQMLDDGHTYADIAAELQKPSNPPLPYPVTEDHIKTWKAGGYQDYLRNQVFADGVRATQEKVLEAAAEDPVKFADAGVQLAATGICELLAELSQLQASDEKASDRYARIANSMARLARVILAYEQNRQALAKAKADEPKQRDPNKPFGDEDDHRAVVGIVDKVLGIDRYRKLMMEQHAAEKAARAAQLQTSATSNVSLTNCADGAPVSNRPSVNLPEAG